MSTLHWIDSVEGRKQAEDHLTIKVFSSLSQNKAATYELDKQQNGGVYTRVGVVNTQYNI